LGASVDVLGRGLRDPGDVSDTHQKPEPQDARPDFLEDFDDQLDRLTARVERLKMQIEHLPELMERSAARPIHSAEHEVEHLREVADEGQSGATPAILVGEVLAVVIPVVAILIAVTFLAARYW
jgi:hypothetical protein